MSSVDLGRVSESARLWQRGCAARAVARYLPFEATPADARATRDSVPFWFHTFALSRTANVYTPGVAHDARRRLLAMPASFAGGCVLDIGTFDGFFAFLAEHRGAERVVAIDNEQYRPWVRDRWGVRLRGPEGFRAIARMRKSAVEYRRLDATQLRALRERFDWILCLGVLHRVSDPLEVLRAMRDVLTANGQALIETYGHVREGSAFRGDRWVQRTFTPDELAQLLALAGFASTVLDEREIHGHPRLLVRASQAV